MIVGDANVIVMALASSTASGDSARAAMLADDADTAFRALIGMQIEYVRTDVVLLQTVWAMGHNVSVYTAAYLAVAAMHDAPLVTFDARLTQAAEQVKPDIRVNLL